MPIFCVFLAPLAIFSNLKMLITSFSYCLLYLCFLILLFRCTRWFSFLLTWRMFSFNCFAKFLLIKFVFQMCKDYIRLNNKHVFHEWLWGLFAKMRIFEQMIPVGLYSWMQYWWRKPGWDRSFSLYVLVISGVTFS